MMHLVECIFPLTNQFKGNRLSKTMGQTLGCLIKKWTILMLLENQDVEKER